MRVHRLLVTASVMMTFFLASSAIANGFGNNGNCNGPGNDCNEVNNTVTKTIKDNFSPSAKAKAGAHSSSNASGGQASVNTRTNNVNSNRQGQHQTGIVRDGDVSMSDNSAMTVEGDDFDYDIPVNSAAPVFAGACSQGISVQTQSFGGSAGTTNPVCDYVAVAGGFVAAGERTEAVRVLGKAEGAADWRYRFSQIRNILTLGLL